MLKAHIIPKLKILIFYIFFAGGISAISDHTFKVAKYFYRTLKSLRHRNGASLAEIYCHGNYEGQRRQGAIVTFNLIRANGEYIGFSEVSFFTPEMKMFRINQNQDFLSELPLHV